MTIRGNYEPTPRGQAAAQGQYTDHGLSIWAGVDIAILNVSIFNTDGELIAVDGDVDTARSLYGGDYSKVAPARNVVIDGLNGGHAARQCVATTAVDGFIMKNSVIDDCQQTGFDAEIDVPGQVNRNIKILNNAFSGVYFAAIQVPVLSLPGFEGTVGNIEVRGNRMTQAPDTCFPAILFGDNRGRVDQVNIADNTLLTVGDGIQFMTAAGSVEGSILNNTIRKTVDNTGCSNAMLTPAHSTPVRLNGNDLNLSENRYEGFCCGQDIG